jgi:hypothetical protein
VLAAAAADHEDVHRMRLTACRTVIWNVPSRAERNRCGQETVR